MTRATISPPAPVALVTGASGFLGSHLVEGLTQSGWKVRGLVRTTAKGKFVSRLGAAPFPGDLTQIGSLREAAAGVNVVFHAAARVDDWGPWAEFESTIVQGTRNLLDVAARAKVNRFVQISTVAVYDAVTADRHRIVTEDLPHCGRGDRAFGHYARAKVLAEDACWERHRRGDLQVTALRPALIYGPRDTAIAPRLVEFLSGPWACWIGRDDPVADPVYVTDVVACALAAATSSRAGGQAYNVAPVEKIRLRDFLGALCHELGVPPPRRVIPKQMALLLVSAIEGLARGLRRRDPPIVTRAGLGIFTIDRHHTPAKAVGELGWMPRIDVPEGVRRTAQWLLSSTGPSPGRGPGRALASRPQPAS